MKITNLMVAFSMVSVLPCSGSDEQALKQLRDAETKFMKAQDDRAVTDWNEFSRLEMLEKKLFVLKRAGRVYLATRVFKSIHLKNGFDLSQLIADDTIHVTEFDYTPIKCRVAETFQVDTAWRSDSLSRCDFYLGDPGQMHADSYRSVVKLAYCDGNLKLPSKLPQRDMLLFAIVKPKDNDYFKFVFVVRPDR